MALNPNHAFEDLGDIKCSIIEKNCVAERVLFLQNLLEVNGKTVVVVKSPPPKAVKPVDETTPVPVEPETFTVGVTDLSFNPTNAIFNRELRTADGSIVTPAYWYQKEAAPVREEKWYWKK